MPRAGLSRTRKPCGSLLTQRVNAATKLRPETYNWFASVPWLTHMSISKILDTMAEYARINEQDFKKFCDEME